MLKACVAVKGSSQNISASAGVSSEKIKTNIDTKHLLAFLLQSCSSNKANMLLFGVCRGGCTLFLLVFSRKSGKIIPI